MSFYCHRKKDTNKKYDCPACNLTIVDENPITKKHFKKETILSRHSKEDI
jgi:hypothetical protein